MKTATVFRIESRGTALPFPTLRAAMNLAPQSPESYIATSINGVTLATVTPGSRPGWHLTDAGQEVIDDMIRADIAAERSSVGP